MQDFRNIFALVAAVTILQLAGGILGVVTPLGLDAFGAGTGEVGLIGALYSAGFMAGAWFSTAFIRTFGNIRVHAAGGAIMTISFLLMYIEQNIWAWSGIRLMQGAAIALMFSSVEAWLGSAMPADKRGSISGFYHLMAKVALIAGPFVIAGMAVTSPEPYMWGAIFMAVALLPITLTRRDQPPMPDREPLSIWALYKLAPSGVFACFMAGVMNTGTLALLPIYAVSELDGLAASATAIGALAAGAAWTGGLISQWPAGKASDKFDRRLVIALMCLGSGLAALIVGLAGFLPNIILLVLIGVWGAGSLSFYGIAVAHIIDWAPTTKMAQAMSGILFVWALGSVLGPVLSGLSMQTPLGESGLFLAAGLMSLVLTLTILVRRLVRPEPPQAVQEPWNPTTPLLAAQGEIDPRAE
ncbi:MAG: MFS transporter [Pseudomonadota bacterium]